MSSEESSVLENLDLAKLNIFLNEFNFSLLDTLGYNGEINDEMNNGQKVLFVLIYNKMKDEHDNNILQNILKNKGDGNRTSTL